ncbi:hypothetical protein [Stieleria varia]|nr:hypothetical protein [Stieleria varia]
MTKCDPPNFTRGGQGSAKTPGEVHRGRVALYGWCHVSQDHEVVKEGSRR